MTILEANLIDWINCQILKTSYFRIRVCQGQCNSGTDCNYFTSSLAQDLPVSLVGLDFNDSLITHSSVAYLQYTT